MAKKKERKNNMVKNKKLPCCGVKNSKGRNK